MGRLLSQRSFRAVGSIGRQHLTPLFQGGFIQRCRTALVVVPS